MLWADYTIIVAFYHLYHNVGILSSAALSKCTSHKGINQEAQWPSGIASDSLRRSWIGDLSEVSLARLYV